MQDMYQNTHHIGTLNGCATGRSRDLPEWFLVGQQLSIQTGNISHFANRRFWSMSVMSWQFNII